MFVRESEGPCPQNFGGSTKHHKGLLEMVEHKEAARSCMAVNDLIYFNSYFYYELVVILN